MSTSDLPVRGGDDVPASILPRAVPRPTTLSWLLGLPDVAYGCQAYLKRYMAPSLRHWTGGWGDLTLAKKVFEESKVQIATHNAGPEGFAGLVTLSEPVAASANLQVLEGSFGSPLKACLPEESVAVPFQAILPPGEPRAVVVICAGTGDESFLYRRKALAEPLAKHGIASLLPMMPFYGPRRRHGQRLFYLTTFCDIMVQCYAGCSENMALLDWARMRWPRALLGITGMSHGAGATFATALFANHNLAVAPLLIPTSPAVLATGSLEHELAFDALGAATLARPTGPSWEEVRAIVVDTLETAVNPINNPELPPHPPRGAHIKCAVVVSALSDSFVLPEWSSTAFERVREKMDPDAELHWVPGGHVSSFAVARWAFTGHILKSFDRLERACKNRSPSARL